MSLTQPARDTPRLLLTSKEAAVALGISERTLYELTHSGELAPIRLPGRGIKASAWYPYESGDLEAWVERAEAAPVRLKITPAKGYAGPAGLRKIL